MTDLANHIPRRGPAVLRVSSPTNLLFCFSLDLNYNQYEPSETFPLEFSVRLTGISHAVPTKANQRNFPWKDVSQRVENNPHARQNPA